MRLSLSSHRRNQHPYRSSLYEPHSLSRDPRRAARRERAEGLHGLSAELGLSEVARIAGLNKTTAFRLLSALEDEGLVQRAPEGEAYRLGPELAALGLRALGATGLLFAAQAELPALAEATQETASLHVLVGREVLILDEVFGGRVLAAKKRWEPAGRPTRPRPARHCSRSGPRTRCRSS